MVAKYHASELGRAAEDSTPDLCRAAEYHAPELWCRAAEDHAPELCQATETTAVSNCIRVLSLLTAVYPKLLLFHLRVREGSQYARRAEARLQNLLRISEERLDLKFGGDPDGYPTIACQKRAGTPSARSTVSREERWYVKYQRPRNRSRALRKGASVKGATGRRGATSAPPDHQQGKARAWSGSKRIPRSSLKKDIWAKHQRG